MIISDVTGSETETDETVAAAEDAGQPVELRKKELIDAVVARSGIKKKDAKPVVEAMLDVLGETISGGRELNLNPLGKLRINRTVDKPNGRVIICKLRQNTAGNDSKTTLAEGSEEE